MGLYARDGSMNVTIVSGDSDLAGTYAPDGSLRVTVTGSVESPGYLDGFFYPLFEGPFTTTSAHTLLETRTYFQPYWFRAPANVKTMGVRTTATTQGVNSQIKLAIYGSALAAEGERPFGAPIVFSNTEVDTNTLSTNVSIDVNNATVPAGLHWLGIKIALGGTPTKPSFFAQSSTWMSSIMGASIIGQANTSSQADVGFIYSTNLGSADWETYAIDHVWARQGDRLGAPIIYIGT